MLAVIGATSAASTFLSKSVLPRGSLLLAAAASSALNQQSSSESESTDLTETSMIRKEITPRAKSCALMATAMAFHFGGYEFARSGALALFTSNEIGFSHPSAYPFAIGLVTPMSLGLLYMYGLILRSYGPRRALKTTKFLSVSFLAIVTLLLKASTDYSFPGWISKALVAFLFVFQNSYAHLLYSQQWSFLGSVMTPTEGTKYFSAIAGLSSLVCTITATLSAKLAPIVGLCGLMIGTSISLAMSLLLADQAYRLGEKVNRNKTRSVLHYINQTHC